MRNLFIFFLTFYPLISFSQSIKVVTIDNYIIGPVTAEYIERGLKSAEDENGILIIKLDTPGGLLNSTQKIVKLLLNTSVPVITYITPSGARAASAGVFISYASHILAMSPSTHIGSAHPIVGHGSWGNLSEEIKEKILNDTLAWAESIALKRKRPQKFIRDAIKKSVSITEQEALRLKVCDLVAQNLDELLEKIDGMTIEVKNKEIKLSTQDKELSFVPFTPREKFLNTIIDPNIAYLLLTLGFLGLIFEVTHPGFGFPGIAGLICLVLSFYALSVLPVNYAGIILIILGVIFFVVEAFTPTFGMFTLGGIISLFLGSIMMFNQPQLIRVSYGIFLPVIIFFSFLSLFLLGKIISIQKEKPRTGVEGLIGKEGVVCADFDGEGKVFIHSEVWEATSSQKLRKGEKVVVERVEGLKLFVKRKEG